MQPAQGSSLQAKTGLERRSDMTIGQQIAALTAIRVRQNAIRESISKESPPELIQYAEKELKNLEGAYNAINAIEITG